MGVEVAGNLQRFGVIFVVAAEFAKEPGADHRLAEVGLLQLLLALAGREFAHGVEQVAVRRAQQLRQLQPHRLLGRRVQHQGRRLVQLRHHLLRVEEHAPVRAELELRIEQVGRSHDPLQRIRVENGRSKNV